ncbi:MAG TPA: hypothetical protein QF901_14415 [Gammaproteobacteria bacterium]|jgi:hypothetical protein|nr:hypothetical protein [Gammaproteobacteria bacterium]
MSVIDAEVGKLWRLGMPNSNGPVTIARQRRTASIYFAVCVIGLLPLLLGMSAGWQAAGLGLWLPGGGFVAVGGWAMLLFPATVFVFLMALLAWFWAGVVLAPPLVWVGAAVGAGVMASAPGWPAAHLIVASCMAGLGLVFRLTNANRRAANARKRDTRNAFLPISLAEVAEQVRGVPDAAARELTAEQLGSLRYLLDRALQPIEEFNGFDIVEQFQPAALRYQLNYMGYALGIAQGSYTPGFQGYMKRAQRNLIEKYLLRKVWGYWVYESCWGHLNFSNFDPVDKDNIMLTGWFGMQVGQYMLNSGDRRYAERGSLTFRLNERTTYEHNLQSMMNSIEQNIAASNFCLYPCEPNWIYPVCNHMGMAALASADAVFGTAKVPEILPLWLRMLDAEFTDGSGSIIGLRSKHTGLPVPFPVDEAGYSWLTNCFSPERGQGLWAIARKELGRNVVTGDDGVARYKLPKKGVDAGNYRPGFAYYYAQALLGAREFGEDRLADAVETSLHSDCGLNTSGGVRSYTDGSNLTNALLAQAAFTRTGDFGRSFNRGPEASVLEGPSLAEADYPDVLVARAHSDGANLMLVLYPGSKESATRTIRLAKLSPGRSYTVSGASPERFTADSTGTVALDVAMDGRTPVTVTPD